MATPVSTADSTIRISGIDGDYGDSGYAYPDYGATGYGVNDYGGYTSYGAPNPNPQVLIISNQTPLNR